MLFGVRKQALLILHERASRLTLVQRPENNGAAALRAAWIPAFARVARPLRRHRVRFASSAKPPV